MYNCLGCQVILKDIAPRVSVFVFTMLELLTFVVVPTSPVSANLLNQSQDQDYDEVSHSRKHHHIRVIV